MKFTSNNQSKLTPNSLIRLFINCSATSLASAIAIGDSSAAVRNCVPPSQLVGAARNRFVGGKRWQALLKINNQNLFMTTKITPANRRNFAFEETLQTCQGRMPTQKSRNKIRLFIKLSMTPNHDGSFRPDYASTPAVITRQRRTAVAIGRRRIHNKDFRFKSNHPALPESKRQ